MSTFSSSVTNNSSNSHEKTYINIRKFVTNWIVPVELQHITSVVDIYTKKIIVILNDRSWHYHGLDYIIYRSSCFSSYVDISDSNTLYWGSDHMKYYGKEMIAEFREAFEADGFNVNMPNIDGFK